MVFLLRWLPTYSGRTVQDLHLVPYFPAVPAGTRHELDYLVFLFLTQFLLVVKKVLTYNSIVKIS